jgi:hypothetical protein
MSGSKRRSVPSPPSMRDVVIRRATPLGRSGEGDQEAYFRLSLFSAERTRIRARLEELNSQEHTLRKRLELIETQMQKLQAGLAERTAEGSSSIVRSPWNEIELEY